MASKINKIEVCEPEYEEMEKRKMRKEVIEFLILAIVMILEGVFAILAYCLDWGTLVMVFMIGGSVINLAIGLIIFVGCIVDPDQFT